MSAAQTAAKVAVMASAVKVAAMVVGRVGAMAAVANAAKGRMAKSAHPARGDVEVKVAVRAAVKAAVKVALMAVRMDAQKTEMKAATNCVKAKHAQRVASVVNAMSALSALRVSVRRVMHAEKFAVRAATKAAAMLRPSWAKRASKPARNVHPVAKAAVNVVSAAVKAAANVASEQNARKGVARAAPTS